jgi:hypothetical protein
MVRATKGAISQSETAFSGMQGGATSVSSPPLKDMERILRNDPHRIEREFK